MCGNPRKRDQVIRQEKMAEIDEDEQIKCVCCGKPLTCRNTWVLLDGNVYCSSMCVKIMEGSDEQKPI